MNYDGDDLINIMTNFVMPDAVAKELCAGGEIGLERHYVFMNQRFISNTVKFLSRCLTKNLEVHEEAVSSEVIWLKDEQWHF